MSARQVLIALLAAGTLQAQAGGAPGAPGVPAGRITLHRFPDAPKLADWRTVPAIPWWRVSRCSARG